MRVYLNKTSTEILHLFLIIQSICLFPFFMTDIIMLTVGQAEICLEAVLNGGNFGFLFLWQWIHIDGYIKLAVYMSVVFFTILNRETRCSSVLVSVCGIILRMFYIFDLGWTIAGSVLFWGSSVPGFKDPTYQVCNSNGPFKGYLFFLLIWSYIIIPVNLITSGFRSKQESEAIEISIDSTRRQTELMNKQ